MVLYRERASERLTWLSSWLASLSQKLARPLLSSSFSLFFFPGSSSFLILQTDNAALSVDLGFFHYTGSVMHALRLLPSISQRLTKVIRDAPGYTARNPIWRKLRSTV